ncbi:MAG: class I SAM-dependent methyltransferase [Smithellaceae bacterium]|nr:class I SAM-dependent methyltransferase [Smithellaceae bacterium]
MESDRFIKFGPFAGELEDTSCRICGTGTPAKPVYKSKEGIGYFRCQLCSLMYASPRFTGESLARIYETSEFADLSLYENWSYDAWRQGRDRTYLVEQQKVAMVSRYLPKGARILDVGCGTGLFVLEAEKNGYRCEGVEPSAMLARVGQEKLAVPVTNTTINNFAPPCKFQGLVIWDVLEHLYDPVAVLRRCADLLEDRGLIFVQVPHYRGLSEAYKIFLCRLGLRRSFKHFGFPWHVYSFDRTSLSFLMKKSGFEPLLFESWSHLLKDGKTGLLTRAAIFLTRRLCLSDYLVCVARKAPVPV